MDKEKIWEKLTDWEKSPTLRLQRKIAVMFISPALKLKNKDSKWWAIAWLGVIGEPSAVPALLKAVDAEGDKEIRKHMVWALKRISIKNPKNEKVLETLPYMLDALKDRDTSMRHDAGEAISTIASPSSIPALVDMLKNENNNTRISAAMVLGKIGGPSESSALLEALKNDGDEYRKSVYAEALIGIAVKLSDENDYLSALRIVKETTHEAIRLYSEEGKREQIKKRRKLLKNAFKVTDRIHDKMNSVDKDKRFPVKRPEIKKARERITNG